MTVTVIAIMSMPMSVAVVMAVVMFMTVVAIMTVAVAVVMAMIVIMTVLAQLRTIPFMFHALPADMQAQLLRRNPFFDDGIDSHAERINGQRLQMAFNVREVCTQVD
ncbi:hypothetical protein GCM10010911_56520 [Paenibacillus nasutitermitis]|uniref:Uncharacterized protein n=1 Tax=Paenibacillus nasutitermitis TaxID=1652958 RepID=A0A916ZDQ9_9BACL|nr:hypothetical protein GCM10010911_56520 [Paenibacillus nasutitermitis]